MQNLSLLILVVCLSATTTGSKMTFSATPGTVTPALTSEVTLTCSLHDTSPPGSGGLVGRDIHNATGTSSNIQVVTSVSILHSGVSVASVTEHHPARSLTRWSNMAVVGGVGDSTAVKGYLNVTLQYPTEEQLGRYECQVHGADPLDDHDVMFTNSLDLTNDAPTITQLMDHIRTLEINSRTHLADFEASKQDKLVKDGELAALQQDKLVKDGELASLKSEMKAKDSQISNLTNRLTTMHTEQSGMKQEFESLKQDSTINNATIKSNELQIQNNSGQITGLGHKTESLTNQLTAMHTEYSSSYNALSTSLNDSRHIETGRFDCGGLSPGKEQAVSTKFSSPYTGAPPRVFISVGKFIIQVPTNTSKYMELLGYLGHVDTEGFTFTCMTFSSSSYVVYQAMSWISFPA